MVKCENVSKKFLCKIQCVVLSFLFIDKENIDATLEFKNLTNSIQFWSFSHLNEIILFQ